jgi:DNA replication initiation complex subunit (GINS family)
MAEETKREETYQALFVQLILSLHSAVMQHLGKLPNPLTNKIERNLDQARMSIDMLDMLKQKTKGNLTDEESRLIERLVSECKLNYVDELAKDEKEKKEKAAKEAEAAKAAEAAGSAEKEEAKVDQPEEAEATSPAEDDPKDEVKQEGKQQEESKES